MDTRALAFYTEKQLSDYWEGYTMTPRCIREGLWAYKGWTIERRSIHAGHTYGIGRWEVVKENTKEYLENTFKRLRDAIDAIDKLEIQVEHMDPHSGLIWKDGDN